MMAVVRFHAYDGTGYTVPTDSHIEQQPLTAVPPTAISTSLGWMLTALGV